ncbi:hypothetical protein Afil01_43710 [Actinorhabdospora filicis]|uniref:Uncharacterized protein n=1 Tax=Actinorhabdospora filicis TaxID=1785913 RepID=A0A9W6WAE0_9ACTN|nr:hypothetical protein [Actinorhabdospora filicis]GLZ79564.1 hypothetical protein Afil01_43710 [Actinorhabdospora filicis]
MTEELFVASGAPSELDALLVEEELGLAGVRHGVGEVALPLRDPSHISIGEPLALPLDDVPAQIADAHPDAEFWQVGLSCSFQAAPGSRFADARLGVELSTVDGGGAVAMDMFPTLIEEQRTVTVTSTAGQASFGFDAIGAELSLPTREQTTELIRYSGRVVAFGLGGDRPAWSFQRTEQREIAGPHRLYLLVRKPRGTAVHARFTLSARVEFVIGGRGFAPTDLVMLFRKRTRTGELVDAPTVPLVP